jgi:hypothetical protein
MFVEMNQILDTDADLGRLVKELDAKLRQVYSDRIYL